MKSKIKVLFILCFLIYITGCSSIDTYTSDWPIPEVSHSLSLPVSNNPQIIWEEQAFILSNEFKKVQCAASGGVIALVGSRAFNENVHIFALDGHTGNHLWDNAASGILANSEQGLFIANGTKIDLVDPLTGASKWKVNLDDARHITSIMYYGEYLFVNSTGSYSYYVVGNAGQIISKYVTGSEFHSVYGSVPFYPELPFGYVSDSDILVEQRGGSLYSAAIYDKLSKQLLWQVEKESISNFQILGKYILWISKDDSIKIVDKFSGELIGSVKITPSINFFDPGADKQHFGYYLCGDNQLNNIYVILGDSRQVFALKFEK